MNKMELGRRVVALLCFFCMCMRDVKSQQVNEGALHQIVTLMGQTCQPNTHQYAVATNLRSDACTLGPDQNVFSEDRSAKTELAGPGRLYKGKALFCAVPFNKTYHAEYRLLIQSSPTMKKDYLIRELQQRDNNGCLILYTYYSPCLAKCLNRSDQLTIMNDLQTFSQHQGPKAFVFSEVYEFDKSNTKGLSGMLKDVDSSVPVFHCSGQSCFKCFNNNVVNQNCFS